MSCVIPILPIELYQFETFERVLGVMDYVEKLFDTTMDCVSGRVIPIQIVECRNKVNGLSSRISSARSRIAQAKGSTKPLNIFSAPSFPKLENEDDQLLPLQKPMPRYHPTVHETEHPGQAPRGTTSDCAMLHSMYMKLKIPTPSMLDLPQQHKEIGLGAIPEDISNASSFLLFNSHSNPYNMDFTEIAVEKKQTNNDRTASVALPEAPKSMQESEDFSKFGKTDFVYQPDTKETPKVDLPSQLNIPGIANLDWDDDDEDEDFSSNFAFGAPKSTSQNISSAPSNISERTQEKMPALPSLPGMESKPSAPPPPQQPKSTPPPPPPAPVQQTASKPPPPPPPQSNSRPPPPPPPPPSSKAPPPPPPKDLPFNPSEGGRGQMLAAIKARQENPLAGLKKTETVDKSGPIVKSQGAAAASSGKKDPFSLLKEQIGLRFNAIHAPAVTDKGAKKPAVMTESKKAHDSDSYSD